MAKTLLYSPGRQSLAQRSVLVSGLTTSRPQDLKTSRIDALETEAVHGEKRVSRRVFRGHQLELVDAGREDVLLHFRSRKESPEAHAVQPHFDGNGNGALRHGALDGKTQRLRATGGHEHAGAGSHGMTHRKAVLAPVLDTAPAVSDERGISWESRRPSG